MILKDHINTVGVNPLIGPHNPVWGPRFPDMTDIYTQHLRDTLHAVANRRGLRVMEGIYAFTSGPVFETPAEIRAYGRMGADIVGMSTAPEAVFAHACGMQVAGVSLVSNLASGISSKPLSHEEVLAATSGAQAMMAGLIDDFMETAC